MAHYVVTVETTDCQRLPYEVFANSEREAIASVVHPGERLVSIILVRS